MNIPRRSLFIIIGIILLILVGIGLWIALNPNILQPHPYACDPNGICNLYSDTIRKANCTVTFADPNCLNQCLDVTKRCKL